MLSDNDFGGLEGIVAELKEKGHDISRSALGRYSQVMERKLAAVKASTQAAAAIAEAAPDDADLRSAAVISLVQTEVFNLLVQMQEVDAESDTAERMKLLSSAAKSVAELSRASVTQKKWQADVREKVNAKLAALESQAGGGKAGFDLETLKRVREEIYGIV